MQFVSAHNGFLMKDTTGPGSAARRASTVTWTGALLVDREGTYEFWAGAPDAGRASSRISRPREHAWRVTLRARPARPGCC